MWDGLVCMIYDVFSCSGRHGTRGRKPPSRVRRGSREIKIALITAHVLLKDTTRAVAIAQHRVLNSTSRCILNGYRPFGVVWVVETVSESVPWYITHITPYVHTHSDARTRMSASVSKQCMIYVRYDRRGNRPRDRRVRGGRGSSRPVCAARAFHGSCAHNRLRHRRAVVAPPPVRRLQTCTTMCAPRRCRNRVYQWVYVIIERTRKV